jgi:hypothetical protein
VQASETENSTASLRIGLLLGVFTRRCLVRGRGGKGQPGVRYPGLRIVARHPRPSREGTSFAVAAGLDRLGDAAPRLQWRHRVGFTHFA